MADVAASIDIDRPGDEVFAFLTRLSRQGDWQESLVSVAVEGGEPIHVGTRVTEVRRTPAGTHTVRYEITELTPGRRFAFTGQGGPVRVTTRVAVDPLGPSACRVTAEFRFEAGLKAKLLLPLVRREAARQLPEDQARLKALLEGAAPGQP